MEFEQTWLESAGLSSLPELMIIYRGQLQKAAQKDVEQRTEIAGAFEALGYNKHEVQNKTHYVCNSEIERKESEAAMLKRAPVAETIAYESDGHPCRVKNLNDGDRVLLLMNADLEERKQFVIKPYRSREAILQALMDKYPDIPSELWATHDKDWKDKASMMLEFCRRMQSGENPVMLSKILVP